MNNFWTWVATRDPRSVYRLNVNHTNTYPNHDGYRWYGYPVRCQVN